MSPRPPTRAAIGKVLRRYWWFSQLRRIQHEGAGRTWSRRRVLSAIVRTPPVETIPLSQSAPYETHLLCCSADYLSAMWALKSYFNHPGTASHLYLHLQGHSTRLMRARLSSHFPDARLVTQREADGIVLPDLDRRGLGRVRTQRASAVMQKLVDVALIGTLPRILVLDSDVLFFKRPDELLEVLRGDEKPATFQRDALSCHVMTPEMARRDLGLELNDLVNTGIVAIERAFIDLELFERLAGHSAFSDGRSGWREQTMYALLGSTRQTMRLLSKSYAISMERDPMPDRVVARHYSGPSRQYLYADGVPWLRRQWGATDPAARTPAE